MAKISIYSTQINGRGWLVQRDGETLSVHRTRKEAWYEAKRLARGAEAKAVLYGKDSSVITENTYEKPRFALYGGATI